MSAIGTTISSLGNILTSTGDGGVDVNALVTQAMAASEAPLTQLQSEQTTVQQQSSDLTAIQTDVNALSTAVQALTDTSGAMNAYATTSSDSNLATATADSTAAAGSHTVQVNSLATTSSYYTATAAASGDATIGTGSFKISVGGGTAVPITVNGTNDTLNELAATINNTQGLGVTASVITDATGARLALVSNTQGAPGEIVVSNDTTGLKFTKAVTGLNASLTVDGVPISSSSNTVTGVIPGVTLNLNGADGGNTAVSINVSPDTTQASAAINQFVSAWNKVVQDINTEFSVSSTGTANGSLESDSVLRDLQQQLLGAITYATGSGSTYTNLASFGINMNDDGTMTVDSSTLSGALASNFSGVQNFLQGASGFATNLSNVLNLATDPTQGSITLDLQGLQQTNSDLSQQISDMQANLTTEQQNLVAEYTQVQNTLQELPLLQQSTSEQLGALKTS